MIRNKKGSVTVFIMLFMVSLMMMFLVFIRESKNAAVKGSFGALGVMWCDSILAEYDLNLQDRYDIFAFYGLQPEIEGKLRYYAGKSVLKKKYVSMSGIESSLSEYSLIDIDNFRDQVTRASKMRLAGKLLGKANEFESHGPEQPRTESAGDIMSDLPSGGSTSGLSASAFNSAVESAGSITDVVRKAGDRFLENEYAFMYFKDRSDDKDIGKTFLNYEIEYLLCGRKSDEANEAEMRLKIVAIRLIFNTLFALKDPEINSETLAAAEVITPGPAVPVTQKILQAGWAACESVNDYNLLVNGKKVPMYKDKVSWALDLESVIKGGIREHEEGDEPEMKEEVPCVDPGNEHGEEYGDYIRAMLYLMDENLMLLRMMDLMQINMRYCHYADFRIKEYNTGLRAVFHVNGGDYEIERKY
ncbi:MAG: hypothetical protein IKF07_08975 [Eubacterium sp.]|nr:hypothetical protein [Eubacterium sp.]